MTQHWLAVASGDHVARGRSGGFMQVCHGKAAPLRRIRPGDGIVYYSPTVTLSGRDRCQSFTAIGTVREGEPYRADMGDGFVPFRRDVDWAPAQDAPIGPLLDRLEATRGQPNWGFQFRFGLVAISAQDFHLIAKAMAAHRAEPESAEAA